MFCSHVAASVVLGISEYLVKIASLMSASDVSADRSENTCSIVGAVLWHINSQKGVFVNLAAACIWLSQVMHSALLLPLKNLDVFHHLFAGIIPLVVVGDSVPDLCYSFH